MRARQLRKGAEQMRIGNVRRGRPWAFGAVLLSGLAYAVLTLVLTPKPVSAQSCSCNAALIRAISDCESFEGGGWELYQHTCEPDLLQLEYTCIKGNQVTSTFTEDLCE